VGRFSKEDSMNTKAFTLVEIAVVSVIIGIVVMIAIPNIISMTGRSYSKDAHDNLKLIYAAQQYYASTHAGVYYYGANDPAINDIDNLNTTLNLSIVPTGGMLYNCTNVGGNYCQVVHASFTLRGLLIGAPFTKIIGPEYCGRQTISPGVYAYNPDFNWNPCCIGDASHYSTGSPVKSCP
jgi:prepilin-type N-terminal cleavage/methylation domain-containing protein